VRGERYSQVLQVLQVLRVLKVLQVLRASSGKPIADSRKLKADY